MASNYSSDQDMERVLRQHFAGEAEDLRAPSNLWESLESRLEPRPAPHRLGWIRRQVLAAARRNWLPVMATGGAVAVAASAVFLVTRAAGDEYSVAEKIVTQAAEVEAIREVAVEKVVIKEVPVERVVEKVVTKEVMVEAPPAATPASAMTQAPVEEVVEVEREVVVEVEVEKIVTQEVVVERVVEVEKIVEAPAAQAAPAYAASEAAPAATAAARPPDTTFRDYGRQPFVATSEDAVSTFSLDTDRTSYELALTWARQGYDVEPDSVRAEEWINAFNYQYAATRGPLGLCDLERRSQTPAGRAHAPGPHRLPGGRSPRRPAAQRHAGARRLRLNGVTATAWTSPVRRRRPSGKACDRKTAWLSSTSPPA